MTPLSNKTLWGWKLTLVILSIGIETLSAIVAKRLALRIAEHFTTAGFHCGTLLVLVTQRVPPGERVFSSALTRRLCAAPLRNARM